MAEQILDCVGVPEFYSDRLGALEDAGSGMLRVVRCIERRGILIPVFSFILPAVSVLEECARCQDVARQIMMGAMALH